MREGKEIDRQTDGEMPGRSKERRVRGREKKGKKEKRKMKSNKR